MWNCKRSRHAYFLRWINRKRKKSYSKQKKAIDCYIKLLTRKNKEWDTKWIQNAFSKCEWKIKKYWINKEMINNALDHKGLTNLKS